MPFQPRRRSLLPKIPPQTLPEQRGLPARCQRPSCKSPGLIKALMRLPHLARLQHSGGDAPASLDHRFPGEICTKALLASPGGWVGAMGAHPAPGSALRTVHCSCFIVFILRKQGWLELNVTAGALPGPRVQAEFWFWQEPGQLGHKNYFYFQFI